MADIAIFVVLALFFGGFFALGFVYLRKKRKERIDALTAELEKPLPADAQLPPPSEEPVPQAQEGAKAADLVAAEREALLAKGKEEELRRARERAEAEAQKSKDDADAQARAAKAREAEDAARLKADAAAATAKNLRVALSATREGIVGKLQRAIGGKQIDASVLDDVEAILFGATSARAPRSGCSAP